jgi:ATP sulfurylase
LWKGKEREELLARAGKLPSIKITMRNLVRPRTDRHRRVFTLTTFMGKADYDRVLKEMRLADGTSSRFPSP